MNTLKTVARYRDAMSAHICAGENSSYISLNYIDELEVKVNPEDYDQAMALINQKD